MKHLLKAIAVTALVAAVLPSSSQTTGDRQECQKAYVTKITGCAQGLGFLEKIVRAGAQKACVEGAKVSRNSCLAGVVVPTCQDSCLAAYNILQQSCETAFSPAVCGGVVECEAEVLSQRANCVAVALDILNACTASCPVQ